MATTVNKDKPQLSFWQIWNMSFGFFGIQFGFELQNSNVSRIFETLGANKDEIPLLWIAAPVTGLIVQPIIGYLSDRTWHPYWGRRRPFFFIGAILAAMALFVMPNSPVLWIAGGMLWILDASINISMEPFRAFVGDKLSARQRTTGFAMQSFFIGVGSVIAALLPWIFTNWFHFSNTAPAGEIPDSVKYSFYIGGLAFLIAVFYTVFTTDEFPPESIEEFKKEAKSKGFRHGFQETFLGIFKMPKTMTQLAFVQFFTWFGLFAMWIYSTNAITSTQYNMAVDKALVDKMEVLLQQKLQSAQLSSKETKTYRSLQADINEIREYRASENPVVISVNLANYFEANKENQLSASEIAELQRVRQQYNDGADWLNVCSSVRNGIAALFAFIIPLIAARTNRKITHMICLIIGGLGLISISFITNPNLIVVSMGMVGIAWASILSMPYAILSGSLPANKMGYYMGVFNFFIVIPQIVAATILGFFTMKVFHANTMYTIVLGGASMILAGLLSLRVEDKD
ncbi:MFS transporter [Emticicia fluvialis]|uniref:MFS transporter n=1 Tax=Emticicia fluvialis TaxID=2974474 RepID=UPI00216647B9|nr:MFS transporter [Emticicia fluvialis]